MLLKYFNSSRLGVFVIILLLPVIYWLPEFFRSVPQYSEVYSGTLFGVWIQHFNANNQVVSLISGLLVVLLNAYLLVQLNTIHIFIPTRTQMPALFYIILAACFNPLHQFTPALLASTLVILVLYRVITTYKAVNISYNFLDAGFLVALASLIYFQAIVFFLLIPVGLVLLRTFNWREWAYAFIGLALPYVFLVSGYFMMDTPLSEYFPGMSDIFVRHGRSFNIIQLISWVFILSMLIYASYFMVVTIDSMKIQGRKVFIILLWLFLISIATYFAIPGAGIEMLSFTAIPISFLFSHFYFRCPRNWVHEVLFSVFLLLVILLRFQ